MRKPITTASFAPHVQGWSYEEFKARFESQMTIEEIDYFARELNILDGNAIPASKTAALAAPNTGNKTARIK